MSRQMWASVLWPVLVFLAGPGRAVPSHASVFRSSNCAYLSACDVRELLMQEINALKEKLVELVNFQVDVNQFRFDNGNHRSEMDNFRDEVRKFMEVHGRSQVASGEMVNDTPPGGDRTLPALHERMNEVERKVEVWSDNDEFLQQRSQLEYKVDELEKKLELSESKRVALWAALNDLSATVEQQQLTIATHEDLQPKLKELEESIGYVSSDLITLTTSGEKLQESLESLQQNTTSQLTDVCDRLGSVELLTDNLSRDLYNATAKADQAGDRLALLTDEVAQLDDVVWKHANESQRAFNLVGRAANITDKLLLRMSDNGTSLTARDHFLLLNATLAEEWQLQEDRLNQLQNAVFQTEASVLALNVTLDAELQVLQSRYDQLVRRLDESESSHKDVQNEVKFYEIRIGNVDKELALVKEQNAAVTSNIKLIRHDVKKMQNSVDQFEKDRTELKANVTDLMQSLKATTAATATSNSTATTEPTKPEPASTKDPMPAAESLLLEDDNSTDCEFFRPADSRVVTSLKGRPVAVDGVRVRNGTLVLHRCVDIGTFVLHGDTVRQCANGSWLGTEPSCERLLSIDELTGGKAENLSDKAPPILIEPKPELNLTTGVMPNGHLVVIPGSRVVLSCLFPKDHGSVSWSFVSGGVTAQMMGHWTHANTRNDFKMSSARPDQTGPYTCTNEQGAAHTIHVEVRDVKCTPPPDIPHVHVAEPVRTRMSSQLQFSCSEFGYELVYSSPPDDDDATSSSSDFRCLPSGEWSRDFPTCEQVSGKNKRG